MLHKQAEKVAQFPPYLRRPPFIPLFGVIAAANLEERKSETSLLSCHPPSPPDHPRYNAGKSTDPMRALRAPLLGNGDRSSGRRGQRLQMFLRQFGSELVSPSPARPRRLSGNSDHKSDNHDAHASIAPGDMDWSSPRSSKGGGGGGGGGRGGRSSLLRADTHLSDDEYLDAVGASVRQQRSFTAEFGSGSDANPALFATSASASNRRAASAPGDGGTAVGERGEDAGKGVWALDRKGRRKWVEENPSSDGESAIEELARTRTGVDIQGEAKENNMSIFSSPSSPSFLGEGSVSVALASEDGSKQNASVGGGSGGVGRDRPRSDTHDRGNDFRHMASSGRGRGGHGAVGGEVVDGYVSLGSHRHQHQQQHRRGSEDDRDGDLLLSGVPREGQGAGVGARGAGAGQALSMFREQLYEEGRGKGGKGGNLASR